ncbi:aminoacyl-tRNA deacylase [Legionella cincinnatiensis]|uniref:YbaK/prolyl-tRNA synthetase associated domain-containing protein n=1 Tax=Legionella cincinnatiensis TaxID=28085 RepID=A0A378IP17_9GAMM|nr:YbaK/EbsC family protein [Legionella cincinnatiensis]KTC92336.1 YbaK/prolyl-tRNA synthetase associated domain-containing protein [Legionella cincinnatiensis]STX36783.1 YbaK/prolyl-tRNA synthetase associated domain-containing protein [Legionella cincinnatiensis]
MLSPSLRKYIDNHHISCKTISHPRAYTALQCAQAAHIKGNHFAKSVVVKLDGKFVLVAIPANMRLDLTLFKKETHANHAEIAHEFEFQDKFKDCEIGAIPLFGDLYGMDVYLAESLTHQEWLAFNAGNHNEVLQMKSNDFLNLVHPKTLSQC